MRINTQRRPGMVHSQKAIRALSLLNKPVTSLHMKLSLGELLTNTSSKVWYALHLTPPPVNVSIPPNQDNSPESPHALWWHLILKSLWEKPCVKKEKTQPFTAHQVHLSIIFQTAQLLTNPQAHLKKIIRLWHFITENKSNSKTIKFKLWGVENP